MLYEEIKNLPESLRGEIYDFICFLKIKKKQSFDKLSITEKHYTEDSFSEKNSAALTDLFNIIDMFTSDFMERRNQPAEQQRNLFE